MNDNYVTCEITWLLKSLKFKSIDIFGAKLGAFNRDDFLTTEDFEMGHRGKIKKISL